MLNNISHQIVRRTLYLIEVEGFYTPSACYWIAREQARRGGKVINPDHLAEVVERLLKRRLERASRSRG